MYISAVRDPTRMASRPHLGSRPQGWKPLKPRKPRSHCEAVKEIPAETCRVNVRPCSTPIIFIHSQSLALLLLTSTHLVFSRTNALRSGPSFYESRRKCGQIVHIGGIWKNYGTSYTLKFYRSKLQFCGSWNMGQRELCNAMCASTPLSYYSNSGQ